MGDLLPNNWGHSPQNGCSYKLDDGTIVLLIEFCVGTRYSRRNFKYVANDKKCLKFGVRFEPDFEHFEFFWEHCHGFFGIAESESIVKIELAPFSEAVGAILTQNWGSTRERLLVRACRWHHRACLWILPKFSSFAGKFWKPWNWWKMQNYIFHGSHRKLESATYPKQ